MTDRRDDQGFAVATQSVAGGPGARRNRSRRLAVLLVVGLSLALIGIGLLGPRLTERPNFDVAYFATPTPRDSPSPSPTPTRLGPTATPEITPLPPVTRPDDAPPLTGELLVLNGSIQRLDLATGRLTDVQASTPWQDAVYATRDGVVCVCIENGFDDRGGVRTVRLVRTAGGATVSSDIGAYRSSADAAPDTIDPAIDIVIDAGHRFGILSVASRVRTGWRVVARAFDARTGTSGPDVPVGTIALPALPAGSPGPSPSEPIEGGVPPDSIWLDGPHVRLSPDGRSAIVWATAQRFTDEGAQAASRGAWALHVAADGTVEGAAPAVDLGALTFSCAGTAFVADDRFAAVCPGSGFGDPSAPPRWTIHTFDADGRSVRGAIELPDPGGYGYGEPLVDTTNGRLYLWDPVELRVVRVDLEAGAVASAVFDPAASAADGVTTGGAARSTTWRDADSSVQQLVFESIAGSPDGARLYAVGFRPDVSSDVFRQKSFGVFVVDPATLALVQHWAPVSSDVAVTTMTDGRVVVGAQPTMNAEGDQVPWQASLTIRDPTDGRVLVRFGQLGTDMPPMLVGP